MIPTLAAIPLMLTLLSAPAGVDEPTLRGPHPFNKDNLLSLHAGYSFGFGDAPAGIRLQGDYHYRLSGPAWFDVQMGVLSGGCQERERPCGAGTGKAVDILAGVAWNFQTSIPVVPHARVVAGPTFLFPKDVRSSAGFLVRVGGGAHYFLYDWFGLGIEVSAAWGLAIYDLSAMRSGNLTSLDANLGALWHF